MGARHKVRWADKEEEQECKQGEMGDGQQGWNRPHREMVEMQEQRGTEQPESQVGEPGEQQRAGAKEGGEEEERQEGQAASHEVDGQQAQRSEEGTLAGEERNIKLGRTSKKSGTRWRARKLMGT